MQQFRPRQLVTDQLKQEEVQILLHELEKLIRAKVPGDVVELGCYEGGSAVAMQELLAYYGYPKNLWLYDSFQGLPEKTREDITPKGEEFKPGALRASKSRLERHFVKRDLQVPEIKKAWFFELDPEDLPELISLAFLDGDYYESIMDSLKLITPKLTVGSVIVVDDYGNTALPGVKKAVDSWLQDYGLSCVEEHTLAIIKVEQQLLA